MTTRSTATLALVTLLLGVYVIAFDRAGSGRGGRNFSAIPLGDPAQITSLTITSATEPTTLQRAEGGLWQMTAPVSDRADAGRVEKLVAKLVELKKLESIDDDPPSDAEMGLDDGALRITIGTADGPAGTLAFGDGAGVDEAIYARWNDGPPFVCWQDARDIAAVPADTLRDIRLLAIPVEKMRRLKIKDESEAFLVVNKETPESPWLIKGLNTPANPSAIKDRLSMIANMGARGFIDNPNGDVAAAFAAGSVTVSLWQVGVRGPTTMRLTKSPDGKSGFATVDNREGTTFSIDPGFVDALSLDTNEANEIRERSLVNFNLKSVFGVQIEAKPDHRVDLAMNEKGLWQLIDGENEPRAANAQRVGRMLKALSEEQVIEFVADGVADADLGKWGLDAPTLTVTLSTMQTDAEKPVNDDGSPNLTTVPIKILVKGQVAPPPQEVIHFYATVQGSGTVVRLNPAFPSIIPIRPLDFRTLYLWPTFDLASLRELKTSRPPQAAIDLTYLYQTNTWTGTLAGDDITARIDESQALKLALELSLPLRATSWVTKGSEQAQALLQQPIRRVEFTLENRQGERFPFGIDIAPINPNGTGTMFYARAIGAEEICIIDRTTFDILNLPLVKAAPATPGAPPGGIAPPPAGQPLE